jgi:L-ascorbate oxidase
MQISAGQRFSVLLHTLSNPAKEQYYLQLESRDHGALVRSYAVINYGPPSNSSTPPFYPPASPPIQLPETDTCFLDYQLRPYYHSTTYSTPDSVFPTAAEVTRRVNITARQTKTDEGAILYLINDYTWNEGLVAEPYLVSLYKNDGKNWPSMERALLNDGLDPVTYAFPANLGEVLEIVIQGTGSNSNGTATHPWHAHGAHYWDLGSGDGIYNATANEEKWAKSLGTPVKREYVFIPFPIIVFCICTVI